MEWRHDGEAVSVLDFRSNFQWKIRGLPGGGGVLTYVSDGEVRRPFLGLNLATLAFFVKEHFRWTILGRKILAGLFLGLMSPESYFMSARFTLKILNFVGF